VNRLAPEGFAHMVGERATKEVLLPEERIDLPTAIHAFTMGSAYVNHLDRETGSIEVGKLADLVVLDQNLFDLVPRGLSEAKVLMTLVEGEKVFVDPAFG